MTHSTDGAVEPGVPDTAIKPVIEAPMEVVGLGVSVADAPAFDHHFTNVRLVIPVRVLEEKKPGRLGHDHTAPGENQAGRQIQMIGKYGKLIGLSISIGVFADFDRVITLSAGIDSVGIIPGFTHPEASALIPGHGNRLGDIGFSGKKFEMTIERHLGPFDASLDRQGMLKRDG